ncbi:MAG TPA: glycoside hydrolase [Allosphingosinicella sp.]
MRRSWRIVGTADKAAAMLRIVSFVLAATLALAGCAPAADGAAPLGRPPAGIDPFYAKYLDAGGIPVIGSAQVPDAAIVKAGEIVGAMLAARPDLRAELVRQGVRVGVIAQGEAITDLPEHRHWTKPRRDDVRLTACELKYFSRIEAQSDRDYWNARSRGTGGRFTTVGAENLLAVPGSRYFGENILVHEFSHAIFDAIQVADPALYAEVERAYAAARAAGRWKGDYAAVTLTEYWAEGTQYWFNTNMLARLDERTILSDRDLAAYDPALAAALAKAYGKRHRIAADPFFEHSARLNVPKGYKSAEC